VAPRITALRAAGRGRVGVELDGAPWRTAPLEAVVRAGLTAGLELDRDRARRFRRELKRTEATTAAARTLARRDVPARELEARLERRGVAPAERRETIERLERAGAVDDARFARARAAALASRGRGDEAIRHDLEARGVGPEAAAAAVDELEQETERARRVSQRLGGGLKAARALARRGFGEDAIEAAVRDLVAEEE
jgi:regulatory protein